MYRVSDHVLDPNSHLVNERNNEKSQKNVFGLGSLVISSDHKLCLMVDSLSALVCIVLHCLCTDPHGFQCVSEFQEFDYQKR